MPTPNDKKPSTDVGLFITVKFILGVLLLLWMSFSLFPNITEWLTIIMRAFYVDR